MKPVGVLGAAIVAACLGTAANAAVVVNIDASGGNVVANTSGSLDLTGLTSLGLYYLQDGVEGSDGYVGTGAGGLAGDPVTLTDGYSGLAGPASFGSGSFTSADAASGDPFALNASYFGEPYVFVPEGYVSGTALSSTATFTGQTLASLGLTPGSYVFSDGTDSVTVNVAGVPEPATWAMMLIGFGMLGASMRYRLRSTKTVYA